MFAYKIRVLRNNSMVLQVFAFYIQLRVLTRESNIGVINIGYSFHLYLWKVVYNVKMVFIQLKHIIFRQELKLA